MTDTSTMTKAPLARAALEHIEANPHEWNQNFWAFAGDCGTTYCFAGHVARMAHPDAAFLFGCGSSTREATRVAIPGQGDTYIKTTAMFLLGLDSRSAEMMFDLTNTLGHLHAYVEQMEAPGFDGHLTCVNPLYHAIDPYDEDE